MDNLEEIKLNDRIIAIIIYNDFKKDGTDFFTPQDFPMQLGYMRHEKGDRIQEHVHRQVRREISSTQETLFVKSGRVRIDFYGDDQKYFASREVKKGDVVLLTAAGHGFEFLEPSELIEVKQGPYSGDLDKVRFEGKK